MDGDKVDYIYEKLDNDVYPAVIEIQQKVDRVYEDVSDISKRLDDIKEILKTIAEDIQGMKKLTLAFIALVLLMILLTTGGNILAQMQQVMVLSFGK